ncbi:MAG: molecular chaperone DnaJ [Hyphomicrobiales bacterium]|nr:molecular chaperone DnaJ [Hyphomicrobiales bacterium]
MGKAGGLIALALALACLALGRFPAAIVLAIGGFYLLGRAARAAPARAAKGRVVRTRLLEVEIDPSTGGIRGRVVGGRFARRTLGSLSPHEATALWREARIKDPDGARVMEAYLDRLDPRWREHGNGSAAGDRKPEITLDEAYSILGLAMDATRADVQRAHREMMKRFHPDQGGSNYLASKINAAKDLLLQRLPE